MIYVERVPEPYLRPWIRSLWYCKAPNVQHAQERVLPNGCIQVLFNLARSYITHYQPDSLELQMPASIIVGARRSYEIIHTADLTELMGIVVEPGAFAAFFRERADLFFEQCIALSDCWPRFSWGRLAEQRTPSGKLDSLHRLLAESVPQPLQISTVVTGSLSFLHRAGVTVQDCAVAAGVSERRLHQLFCEQVGVSPKLWSRIHRFQKAVKSLHCGADIPWAELALQCGYYDQPHFINDFRAFSGVNPLTYTSKLGRWRNHIPVDPTPAP